jgi:hypothetical protein
MLKQSCRMKHRIQFLRRRREFITLLGGAAAWPLVARAQQTAKVRTIGFLGAESAATNQHFFDAFREGMRDHGYIDGKNIIFVERWAEVVDPLTVRYRRRIVELATTNQLLAMYGFREFVEVGGLMAYGVNVPYLCRRAAVYVDKIIKGATPAELPVEQPTRFELVFNLKTAKALGIEVPPTLLARADEVIE